jgi:hypothetical protein
MTVLRSSIATNGSTGGPIGVGSRAARVLTKLRSQIWYKALDAVVTAPTRPKDSLGKALRAVLDLQQANYDRVGALMTALDHLLPGVARRFSQALLQPEALALRYERCEPLAFGSGGTVYLLTNGPEQTALKIYRRSLGAPVSQLSELIAEFCTKYDTVLSWYTTRTVHLVVPSCFVILHNPLRRVPALASIQRYIAPPHHDLFTAFGHDDLALLASVDQQFAQQLEHFIGTTVRVYEEEARCLDCVGAENVLVVPTDGKIRLLIHDYGVFDLSTLAQLSPATLIQLEERIAWLRALQTRLAAVGQGDTR